MKKVTNRSLLLIVLAVAAVCALAAVFTSSGPARGDIARVTVNGELLYVIDLDRVEQPYLLKAGEHNTLLVEKGAVSMHSADCPDQVCVHQGKTRAGGLPIVCLPNKVVVTVVSDKDGGIDAVSGR